MLIDAKNIEKFLTLLDFEEMKQICRPLDEHFGLTSFIYRKSFNDGSEINISNQPNWVEYFYQHSEELLKHSVFDQHPDLYQSGLVLWSQLIGHQPILERARHFNINHGMTIVKKVSDGVELYYFGTQNDRPKVVNYYLNHVDLLERFILYFKEQAREIIEKSQKYRIVVPKKFERVRVFDEDWQALRQSTTREEFLKATELKHYHVQGEFKGVVLSARELEVVECFLKGMTSEEIGKAIFLSSRTVEEYLSRLREKFHAKNKSVLRDKLIQSDFISYFPQK